ncbi:PstS family phosphate ABC transporter substrate-binding protein [Chlorogloea sp. CCALA 695]|uniref:PstS family phosphate ABC transporter substrate-binding protein n=1 Tax=Chlorogloea sp. CCALA 695 TaxID=2107693 RepID=UPI000D0790BC|nr:PstS family phosphate ABC transporter substrate-binding protein [Chlorogloea sp. CCALA 695]PSB30465.1 ABC transporter substrate-binding protein [Chlorogloea sp. CCALA 695]
MNITANRSAIAFSLLLLITNCTAVSNTASQSQQKLEAQVVKIDGSSTVFPITDAIAKDFQKMQANNVKVTVAVSGTGGGFKKFCAGETDISNASRPILTVEIKACNSSKVRYIELPIAYDALTLVVHPENTWAKSITTTELKKIWEPLAQGKITRWKQVRPDWPDQPLTLYGPGKESGTFDYFTEAIIGKAKASRSDYVASEDDDVLVQGVSKDPNALGYFGFAYYEANQNKLKAVAINNGKESVLPSRKTVEGARYQPLSRPLFIYVNARAAQTNPAVKEFVDFYIKKAPTSVSSVGYVPLPADAYRLDNVHFNRGKVGTVYGGENQINLTLGQLLRKEAKF